MISFSVKFPLDILLDTKGSEEVNDLNVTQALLKAILELIEKCETLEELRESVKRIMNEQ